jgi:hypothetical protein
MCDYKGVIYKHKQLVKSCPHEFRKKVLHYYNIIYACILFKLCAASLESNTSKTLYLYDTLSSNSETISIGDPVRLKDATNSNPNINVRFYFFGAFRKNDAEKDSSAKTKMSCIILDSFCNSDSPVFNLTLRSCISKVDGEATLTNDFDMYMETLKPLLRSASDRRMLKSVFPELILTKLGFRHPDPRSSDDETPQSSKETSRTTASQEIKQSLLVVPPHNVLTASPDGKSHRLA